MAIPLNNCEIQVNEMIDFNIDMVITCYLFTCSQINFNEKKMQSKRDRENNSNITKRNKTRTM